MVIDANTGHVLHAASADAPRYPASLTKMMTLYLAFEDSTATFEKLLAAKSLEQALEIQTSYVRRAYDDYMQQMTRVATMFADLAKEAYKPMERMMYAGR